MKFLCNVCGEKFPFASDYQVTKPCICKTKNVIVHTQNVVESTKQKQSHYNHYNYRHKQKSSKATIDKYVICNKTFQRSKYLKEHMKAHKEDLPFECDVCGERFKWHSGYLNRMKAKHPTTKESLSDKFRMPRNFQI